MESKSVLRGIIRTPRYIRGVLCFGDYLNSLILVAKETAKIFSFFRLSQASAALAFYLTMTFFPMLIVVCAALGGSEKLHQLLVFGEKLVGESVIEFIRNFLVYVENSDGSLLVPLGFVVLISYTSAAFRSVYATVGLIQGGAEHRGIRAYLFSMMYSLVLIVIMYFSVLVMTAGEIVLTLLSEYAISLSFLHDWMYGCYALMGVILFILLLALYHTPKRRFDKYSVIPGALFSSLSILLISPVLTAFMGRSIKYSLVYGSIASVILLMLWIYMCCMVLYMGAAMNVALYKIENVQDH